NRYWPRIPAALVEMSPNPVWVIEALTAAPKARIFGSVDEAIAAATERDVNQSSGVDRSGRVDQCQSSELDRYRSSAVDPTSQVQQTNQSSPAREPVKSSTDSISSLNLFSSSQGEGGGEAADTTRNSATSLPAFEKEKGGESAARRKGLAISQAP